MIKVRRAEASDKSEILRFTEHTFDWGDYVAEVIDDWIRGSDGCLLVAEDDGIPVGMLHLACLGKDEGWLQGMRINPAYRNRGLATLLNQHAISEAQTSGISVLRMAINDTNVPSKSLATKLGFSPVLALHVLEAPVLQEATRQHVRRATPEDAQSILSISQESAYRGLSFYGWQSASLRAVLPQAIDQGTVFIYESTGPQCVEAFCLTEPEHHEGLEIANLCGNADVLTPLLKAMQKYAFEIGKERVVLVSVQGSKEEALALSLGFVEHFDTGDESGVEYIYEKRIR